MLSNITMVQVSLVLAAVPNLITVSLPSVGVQIQPVQSTFSLRTNGVQIGEITVTERSLWTTVAESLQLLLIQSSEKTDLFLEIQEKSN